MGFLNLFFRRKQLFPGSSRGGLSAGYGSGGTSIGPELGFGHVIGHLNENQVLLIKVAYGGRSLGNDFLPPSSGSTPATVADGEPGYYYQRILDVVSDVTTNLATYFPGYKEMFTKIGEERGFPPVTRHGYMAQVRPEGALVVGNPEDVAAKILRHSAALGGIDRFTFQMDAGISHDNLLKAIKLIGRKVMPLVAAGLKSEI